MVTVRNEACWTREAIAEIVAALGRPPAHLDESTPMPDALGDSLDAIEVALGVERRIGVALTDDDLSHVPTFGALVDLIAERA
ncbi:MAG: acyl carrier protein [Reyranellaceae bacterium]